MQAVEEDPLEGESDTEVIPRRERMELALISFAKAIKRWDEYELQPEIKPKQVKPSLHSANMSTNTMFVIQHYIDDSPRVQKSKHDRAQKTGKERQYQYKGIQTHSFTEHNG